jgi:hypothetical protein
VRAVLVLVILSFASPARADDELAEAKRLEATLEYEKALAIVDRVIAHGGADPSRIAELHLLAGRLAAGLDRSVIAEDHFAKVLALEPDAALPEGTSPKLTAPFYAARSRAKPLRVTATITWGLVTIVPDPDPLQLVVGVQAHIVDHAGHHSDLDAPHALRVQLPEGVTALEIAALDGTGNHVWVAPAPADSAAPKPTGVAITNPSAPAGPAFYGRWTTWAAVSGVALAIGGASAWRFSVAQDQWNADRAAGTHDFTELRAIEDRGRQWGLAANISLGVAAATAITATIIYLTHHTEPPPVSISATPRSIDVVGRF